MLTRRQLGRPRNVRRCAGGPATGPGPAAPGGPGLGAGIVPRAAGPRMPLLAGNGAGVWGVLLIGWGLAAAAWLAWLAGRVAAAPARGDTPAVSGTGGIRLVP